MHITSHFCYLVFFLVVLQLRSALIRTEPIISTSVNRPLKRKTKKTFARLLHANKHCQHIVEPETHSICNRSNCRCRCSQIRISRRSCITATTKHNKIIIHTCRASHTTNRRLPSRKPIRRSSRWYDTLARHCCHIIRSGSRRRRRCKRNWLRSVCNGRHGAIGGGNFQQRIRRSSHLKLLRNFVTYSYPLV